MGIYMMINDWDRENKRSVTDRELNDIFQEALEYDPSLMISEHNRVIKTGFFRSKNVCYYNVYHECFYNGISAYEARQQLSACGSNAIVMAYLYGIINGYITATKKPSS